MILNSATITGSQFSRFLSAKKVSFDCPACKSKDSMVLLVDDSDITAEEFSVKGLGQRPALAVWNQSTPNAKLSVVSLIQSCDNCGYLRHFHAGVVAKFLEEESQDNGERGSL